MGGPYAFSKYTNVHVYRPLLDVVIPTILYIFNFQYPAQINHTIYKITYTP